MMDHERVIEIVRASPLAEFADFILEQMLPSARLLVEGEEAAGTNAGSSHFGGLPSLPRGVEWPRWGQGAYLQAQIARLEEMFKKNPRAKGLRDMAAQMRQRLSQGPLALALAFLCQISLRELHAAAPLEGWPSDGSLAFFYDPSQECWGFDPQARGHCRVLYVPASEELVTTSVPADLTADVRFPNRRLSFTREWTLPDRLAIQGGDLSIWDNEDFAGIRQQLMSATGESEPIHRCGGHPQQIQGDMQLECQLVTNGLYCGDPSGYEDPRSAALEPGAAEWQLILQIDSDEERLGWMWGDSGRVYFWIRRQDLAAADFESAWAILQCY